MTKQNKRQAKTINFKKTTHKTNETKIKYQNRKANQERKQMSKAHQ